MRWGLSVVLLIAGIGMLTWGILPARHQRLVQLIPPVSVSEVDGELRTLVVLQDYQVVLEWPVVLRIGDTGRMTLRLEPGPGKVDAQAPPSTAANSVTINNLMAESRFEAAGLQVDPANPRRESLLPGRSVKHVWQISAQKAGTFRGNVWLSLRVLPLSGGAPSDMPVFIHETNIHASSLLGLSGPQARLGGSVGILVGLALGMDGLLTFIRRLKRDRTPVSGDAESERYGP